MAPDDSIPQGENTMMKRLLATALAFPLLCSAAQADTTQLDRIFTRANINVPWAKLEQVTGSPIALKEEAGTRRYQVGQCLVTAYSHNGETVSSLELEIITPSCTFDMSQLVKVPKGTYVHKITFGQFAKFAEDDGINADCLDGCPEEPSSVSISWQGPESEQYLEIITHDNLTSPESKAAATKWIEFMKEQEGSNYRPNSAAWTLKYTKQGLAYFQDIPIPSIRIGYCMLDCCHDEGEE